MIPDYSKIDNLVDSKRAEGEKSGFWGEHFLQFPFAEGKDRLYLIVDEKPGCQSADKAFANIVVQDVGHFDASGHLPEMVFVVPEAVGADALLVDEIVILADVGDFGDPVHGNIEEWRYLVSDEQSLVHFPGHFRGNHKRHVVGGDLVQIAGRRKEIPGFRQG